jgi:hypothetical protein
MSTLVYFQFVFAAITVVLIAGALLGRMNFKAWMLFVPLWLTFSYTVGKQQSPTTYTQFVPFLTSVFRCILSLGRRLVHPTWRPRLRRWLRHPRLVRHRWIRCCMVGRAASSARSRELQAQQHAPCTRRRGYSVDRVERIQWRCTARCRTRRWRGGVEHEHVHGGELADLDAFGYHFL